jgi:hypothetical protein
MTLFRLLTVSLLTASIPLVIRAQPPAGAQLKNSTKTVTLFGTVRDLDGKPIAGADAIAGPGLRGVSNERGEFVVRRVPAGVVELTIRKVGYVPSSIAFRSPQNALSITFAARMVEQATNLGTVVVEGKSYDQDLWNNGFYKRSRGAFGTFFGPELLDKTAATLSGIVSMAPNVRLVRLGNRVMVPVSRNADATDACQMNVYLDGVFQRWAADEGIDNIIAREDVKGIEVYGRDSEIPASLAGIGIHRETAGINMVMPLAGRQFGASQAGAPPDSGDPSGQGFTSGKACGAILLWTRLPQRPGASPVNR